MTTAAGRVQHTLSAPVTFSGIGLHSGAQVTVVCRPAAVDAGISFLRTDLRNAPPIAASVESVAGTTRGVTLGGRDGVRTVEHLLAAAAGMGISNLRVDVHGPELPALDGSAAPYCRAFQQAGLREQPKARFHLSLIAPVWVSRGSAWVLALPEDRFRATYIVQLPSPALGIQVADVEVDREHFAEQIAPARTWGLVAELDALRAEGFARGAGADNALGIGPDGYTTAPRFPDEPARHKILDLCGDLSLLGRPLHAHVIACGAGHALHLELARAIQRRTPP